MNGYTTHVGTANRPGLWMAAFRKDVDERFVRVAAREERLQIDVGAQRSVKRGMDTADHRREMRGENELHGPLRGNAEPLADLRQMTMPGHSIRLEIVGGLGEESMNFGLSPSPRNTRFRVRDQVIDVDRAAFDERQESELDGRRVAARIRHDASPPYALAVDFRKAIYR